MFISYRCSVHRCTDTPHSASAPFSAPMADFRGGNYAAHYQAVTAAQSQGPGGVGSVGYVEVAGHELLFDLGLDCLF